MATECSYYEALRKQRVLDRAYAARGRLKHAQEKKLNFVDKATQVNVSGSDRSRTSSRVSKRIEALRRDLNKQELILRDSNLVMGKISPREELRSYKQELILRDSNLVMGKISPREELRSYKCKQ